MFGCLVIAVESEKRDVNVDGDVRGSLAFFGKKKETHLLLRSENARREEEKDRF